LRSVKYLPVFQRGGGKREKVGKSRNHLFEGDASEADLYLLLPREEKEKASGKILFDEGPRAPIPILLSLEKICDSLAGEARGSASTCFERKKGGRKEKGEGKAGLPSHEDAPRFRRREKSRLMGRKEKRIDRTFLS